MNFSFNILKYNDQLRNIEIYLRFGFKKFFFSFQFYFFSNQSIRFFFNIRKYALLLDLLELFKKLSPLSLFLLDFNLILFKTTSFQYEI
jgi:hypothetical protein